MSVITNNPVELDETTDPAPTEDLLDLDGFAKDLRVQVISGGLPYILVIVNPETAEAQLEQVGFQPDMLVEALTEIAETFRNGNAERVS